jgi:hypothetical protein
MEELLALRQCDFRSALSQLCESHGSQSAAARAIGLPVSQINETLSGRRDASDTIIRALGYTPVVRYIRTEQPHV